MSAGSEREKTAAAVAALGALPMPVGPGPQASRPIAYAAKNTDLLLADAAERSRAAEWPWDMWCRICHIRPTSHRTEAEALEAADRHVKLGHAPQAEVHKLMVAGGLAELDRVRARVAELEAVLAAERGRHTEYEDSPHCRLDGEFWPCRTVAALDAAPSVEVSADKLTQLLAPTQALREDEPAEPALIVYRAGFHGHDIPLGFYDNQAAARTHCEAFARREMPDLNFDWIEDEEGGVAEMTAWIGGEARQTGYVVTALEVASAYDPDGDE